MYTLLLYIHVHDYVLPVDILCQCVCGCISSQTMLVPMAENLLGWTERDTSIFYSVAGLEVSLFAYM